MKSKTAVIRTTLLALAGTAILMQSAQAQSKISVASGDIILGVEAGDSSQQGSTKDYEVDLGNIANLSLTGTTDFGNIVSAADLAGQYGTSFTSSTDLYWSVVGLNLPTALGGSDLTLKNSVNGISTVNGGAVFVTDTDAKAPLADNSYPDTTLEGFGFGGLSHNGVGNVALNGATSTANTPFGALLTATQGNAYTKLEDPSQGGFFGVFAADESRVSFGSGDTLGLYLLNPTSDANIGNDSLTGTSTLLGTFSFTDGDLTFTGAAEAVPEPSSYALAIAGMALLFVLRRRQLIGLQS